MKKIAITTILLLAFVVALVKTYQVFHRPFTHHISADLQCLSIIDMDNSQRVTRNGLLNGEDTLLVVDHATLLYQQMLQKIPEVRYLSQEELLDLHNLHLFDKDRDDKITPHDVIFPHLMMLKFSEDGTKYDLKSLSALGVKAIYINNSTPTGAHSVEMSDGKIHRLLPCNKFEKKS